MNFLRIWITSSLIVTASLLAIALYDGSVFVILVFAPFVLLISAVVLGFLGLLLRILKAKPAINWLIPYGAAVVVSLYLINDTNRDTYIRSDPQNDFKRFVMQGPHWADKDAHDHYSVNDHSMPRSVRAIKSRTFENFDGEGAAVYFQASKADLRSLLDSDRLGPGRDPRDLQVLNRWAGWYLWVKTNDLGTSPDLYVRKSDGNIEEWLMAVNHEQNRALFLYLNVN